MKFIKRIIFSIYKFINSNRQFIAFIILAIIPLVLLRRFTVSDYENGFTPILFDFGGVLLIGSFAYLFRPVVQYRYFL